MSTSVVTAVSAHAEAAVATALGSSSDVRVVRRCPDVADLLAVTQSGRAQVAVLSPDLPGVRRSVLADLRASGVAVSGSSIRPTKCRSECCVSGTSDGS